MNIISSPIVFRKKLSYKIIPFNNIEIDEIPFTSFTESLILSVVYHLNWILKVRVAKVGYILKRNDDNIFVIFNYSNPFPIIEESPFKTNLMVYNEPNKLV